MHPIDEHNPTGLPKHILAAVRPEAQIVPFTGPTPETTREYADRLAEARRYLEAVIDAQARFARLAELIEEVGLTMDAGDPRKLEFAALAMMADNSRRAMEEARAS